MKRCLGGEQIIGMTGKGPTVGHLAEVLEGSQRCALRSAAMELFSARFRSMSADDAGSWAWMCTASLRWSIS